MEYIILVTKTVYKPQILECEALHWHTAVVNGEYSGSLENFSIKYESACTKCHKVRCHFILV